MPATTAAPSATSPHAQGADPPPAAGLMRIVIADDHPVDRDGIVRALMGSGRYQIAGEAGDGEPPCA
jgi:hypothetical protein